MNNTEEKADKNGQTGKITPTMQTLLLKTIIEILDDYSDSHPYFMTLWHQFKELRELVLQGDLQKICDNPVLCRILNDPTAARTESEEVDASYSLNSQSAAYSVLQQVGSGTYGQVFNCRNETTKQQVVLKKYKENVDDRFARKELSVLRYLKKMNKDSKYIVNLLDSLVDCQRTYLVFEKLEESLFEALARKQKPMTLRIIRPIAKQLFLGLEELQAANIIHADIKPNNIMLVDSIHQPYRVKIIDFGMALKGDRVRPNMLVQAAGYRAPEVLLGLPFTEAIDIWAAGCTLACLYMAQHLFHGNNSYEMMKEIVELLGQPSSQWLRKGPCTDSYFIEDHAADGSTWRLRPPESEEIVKCRKVVTSLLDLMEMYPSRGAAQPCDKMNFILLLEGLLDVDMDKRFTAQQALKSPFITMKHLTRQYEATDYVTLSQDTMNMCLLSIDRLGSMADCPPCQPCSGNPEAMSVSSGGGPPHGVAEEPQISSAEKKNVITNQHNSRVFDCPPKMPERVERFNNNHKKTLPVLEEGVSSNSHYIYFREITRRVREFFQRIRAWFSRRN